MSEETGWAEQEFGHAELGDARRVQRLVRMAADLAARPAGRITSVMERPADREAAFRFVENDAVPADAIALASHAATAKRCAELRTVTVPVDQSTLTLIDRTGEKGFGRTGGLDSRSKRGLEAMTALAVDESGATLGVVAQQWWLRSQKRTPDWDVDRRPPEERESHLWTRTLLAARDRLRDSAPSCEPWFQMDRGADCAAVLLLAHRERLKVTVRASHDRALVGTTKHLWQTMKGRAILGQHRVTCPRRSGRAERTATLSVRSATLQLRVATRVNRAPEPLQWTVVYVSEQRPPRGENRIEWMLLTTHSVHTKSDAVQVVNAYTHRWRVEEFHRAWKSGVCDIESSQLRSPAAFMRWATISAAVAGRAERLKYLSRTQPDLPSDAEFSSAEVDAAILLSKTRHHKRGDALTLGEAVALVAQLGGYTGKSSGGPPGVIVIGRGLQKIETAAAVIDALRRSG